jgi:hypothetical protein
MQEKKLQLEPYDPFYQSKSRLDFSPFAWAYEGGHPTRQQYKT